MVCVIRKVSSMFCGCWGKEKKKFFWGTSFDLQQFFLCEFGDKFFVPKVEVDRLKVHNRDVLVYLIVLWEFLKLC